MGCGCDGRNRVVVDPGQLPVPVPYVIVDPKQSTEKLNQENISEKDVISP